MKSERVRGFEYSLKIFLALRLEQLHHCLCTVRLPSAPEKQKDIRVSIILHSPMSDRRPFVAAVIRQLF